MNDQQRAAMQMALEALEANMRDEIPGQWTKMDKAATALREALAQADKPHVVRDGGNWGMSPRYKCSGCDEEFRSEHRAHWHCQNECQALEQPQGEPVAWMYERENSITNVHLEQIEDASDRGWKETPLHLDPSCVRVVVVPAYDGSNVEARAKRGTK